MTPEKRYTFRLITYLTDWCTPKQVYTCFGVRSPSWTLELTNLTRTTKMGSDWWWNEKCTAFRGSFKPEIVFIWSNIALNRSFCQFRCFGEEIWKRKHFGRFWSIKVKNSTKCQRLLEIDWWRRHPLPWQRHHLTGQNRFFGINTGRRQVGHPRNPSGGEVTASAL